MNATCITHKETAAIAVCPSTRTSNLTTVFMRDLYTKLLMGLLLFCGGLGANGQVTTNSGSGLAPTYPTLANAITALNGATISSPVIIDLNGSETAPLGGYSITATGTVSNTIVIRGNNNVVTAPTPQASGVLTDAIFKIIGGDFITIQNFSMNENAANTTIAAATNNMTEFGVALFYATTTNGAQNNTIQANTITLNRTYQNTFGIYSNSTHTATVVTTSASATTAAGGNSGLKIYGNTITNVNQGISVIGPTAAADMNAGLDIGGTGGAQANNIINWGTTGAFSGYANVSGTLNCILVRNTINFNISFNILTSSVGGNTVTTSQRAIYVPSFSVAPTGTLTNTIGNNNISVRSGLIAGTINGIIVETTTGTSTSSLNISTNNFNNFSHTVSGTGAITFINSTMANLNTVINSNTFSNITTNTTGSVTFISNSITVPAGGSQTINSNMVSTFNKTGAGGTITGITTSGGSTTVTSNWNSNSFLSITVTGATTVTLINNTDGGSVNHNITGNIISTITGGTGSITAINSSFGGGNGGNGNLVSNNTINGISSAGSITGIAIGSSGTSSTVSGNTISVLSSSGASAVVSGITSAAPTSNDIFKNTICNLASSNASGSVNGILVSAGTLHTIYNNRIGDLHTTAANAINPLVGLNITGGTTVNAYHNTINLAASSSGALFGSSAISASTTPTVTLNNNIFNNTSTSTGTGLTVAYRRSTTTLTTYGGTSNTNFFYAGSPAASRLIFFDGTNSDLSLAAYKTRVASRDAGSVTENLNAAPTFLSTVCGNANFLKINTAVATQLESGGTPIGAVTDDFEGEARNATTPDIGADEFAGIPVDFTAPSISYTPLANNCGGGARSLTATITDPSGVPTSGLGLPVAYWKIGAGSYNASPASAVVGSSYTFSIGAGSVVGDVISYYIVAQDNAGTPNVGSSPSGGATGFTIHPPAAGTPPTTPSTYTNLATLSGTYTVGAGGNYTTLTAAVTDYNAKCLTGPVLFSLTDATYASETYPIIINANPGASAFNTLTIQPATGVSAAFTGSAASALIVLNGADYVNINGSNTNTANTICPLSAASRNLTLTNTSTSTTSAVIWLQTVSGEAATNNSVLNCNLVGSGVTQTLFGVGSGSTTMNTSSLGTGNNNNSFINNNISGVQYGIYSQGASAANKNQNTVINQNLINTSANTKGGIWVGFENLVSINANDVSNIAQASSPDVFGITLGMGTSVSATTSGGNEVTNATVTKNVIGTVINSGTFSAVGIAVASATSGTTLLANNSISGVAANGTGGDLASGIILGGGTGSTTNVYYNTVLMQGSIPGATSATQTSACLTIANSTAPTVDLRNNAFVNRQSGNIGATLRFACIALNYSSTLGNYTGLTSNNNNLFSGGGGPGTYHVGITGGPVAGTSRTSLANWTTETGRDGASTTANPVFASPTDLRPVPADVANVPMYNGGIAVSVTDDIDCTNRANISIGIKEFLSPVCATAVAGTASATPASLCGSGSATLSATGYSGGLNSTYQWQSSVDAAFSTPVNLGTDPTNQATGVLTSTTYYRLLVGCTSNSTNAIGNTVTVTVNPIPTVGVSPSSATYCSPGGTAITLTANGASTYVWTPTLGLTPTTGAVVSASPSVTTTYTVTGTDANGCTNTATATITVSPNPVNVVASATPTSICQNSISTLTATVGSSLATTILSPLTAQTYTTLSGAGITIINTNAGLSVGMDNTQDDGGALITLPFSFSYLGNTFTQMTMCTNGWIGAGNHMVLTGAQSRAPGSLFSTTIPNNTIAPWFKDMGANFPLGVGSMRHGLIGTDVYAFQWDKAVGSGFSDNNSNTISFQVNIYGPLSSTPGRIEYIYGPQVGTLSTGAAIGVENATGGTNNYINFLTGTGTSTSTSTAWPGNGNGYRLDLITPTYSWTPAASVVNPNAATTSTVPLSATQTFNVVVSYGSCFVNASTTVVVNPLTAVNISTTGGLCAGVNFTATANTTGGSPAYNYVWSDGTATVYPNAQTITVNLPAGSHTLSVNVTETCGGNITMNLPITVNALPTVTVVPSAATICMPGGSAVSLTASGASTYTWLPTAGLTPATGATVSALPAFTTTYTVTGTDANGCVNTGSAVVTIAGNPSVLATANPVNICPGGNSQLNAIVPTTAAIKITEVTLFRTGTGATNPYPAFVVGEDFVEISNISATAVDITGWVLTDHATNTVASGHTAFAFPVGTILPANSVAVVHLGTGTDAIANRFYNTGGATDFYFSGSLVGIVLKNGSTVVDAVGCGSGYVFNAGTGVTAGDWSGFAPSASGLAGTKRTAGQDSNTGADWSASSLASPQSIGTYNGGYTSYVIASYLWSPSTFITGQTSLQNPLASGVTTTTTYTVLVTTTEGCTASASVTVIITPLVCDSISYGGINNCVGTKTLTAHGSGGGGPYTYKWYEDNNGTGPVFATTQTIFTSAGSHTYCVKIFDACGDSCIMCVPIKITSSLPNVVVTPSSGVICSPGGSPITLTASGANTFIWAPATGLTSTTGPTVSAQPTSTITYTVTGTDANGCVNTATVLITLADIPQNVVATATPPSVCLNSGSTLSVTSTLPSIVSAYSFGHTDDAGTLDPMVGASTVVASGVDDEPMSSDNINAGNAAPIGFNIFFEGLSYSHYSASPDGWIKFSNSTAPAVQQFVNNTTSSTNIPKIYPYWDDMATGTNGNVTALVDGTSPNRILKVQWFVTIPRAVSGPANSTFQAWVYESDGRIEYRYGAMGTPNSNTSSAGMTGAVATNFHSITIASNTSSTTTANDDNSPAPLTGSLCTFTPPTAVLSYAWSPAVSVVNPTDQSTLTQPITTASETFSVVVSNGGCAAAPASVTVTTAPLTAVSISTTGNLCAGANVTATANTTGGSPVYNYAWSDGSATVYPDAATVTVNLAAGSYTLSVTVTDVCGSTVTMSLPVVVNATPVVSVTPSAGSICLPGGAPVSLTASGAPSFAWAPAAGLNVTTGATVSANPSSTTTYTVTGTDANGCMGTASALITVGNTPLSGSAAANPNPVCAGTPFNLTSMINMPGYVITNSAEAFIDISGTGTPVSGLDDDSQHDLTFPFPIIYNGISYTGGRVTNNGTLIMGTGNVATSGGFNNLALPQPASAFGTGNTSAAVICAYWDDLVNDVAPTTTITTQLIGSKYIIQWTNEDNFNASGVGRITFQIIIYDSLFRPNRIALVYPDVTIGVAGYDNGENATVGLNFSSTSAQQYSFNTASLVDGESITFTPNAPTYSWTGPNGFTSSLQNPVIASPTAASAGVYTVTFTGTGGCTSTASTPLVVVNPCGSDITVTAFLEGYYLGGSTMINNLEIAGVPGATSVQADTIEINLWDPTDLLSPTPHHSQHVVISTSGVATASFPSVSGLWWVAVKHRNHLETWSAAPINMVPGAALNFTTNMSAAYADVNSTNTPMKVMADGKFAFYGGDVDQDGTVAGSDMNEVDNGTAAFEFGYNRADCNGDGETGGADMNIIDNNTSLFLFYARPF